METLLQELAAGETFDISPGVCLIKGDALMAEKTQWGDNEEEEEDDADETEIFADEYYLWYDGIMGVETNDVIKFCDGIDKHGDEYKNNDGEVIALQQYPNIIADCADINNPYYIASAIDIYGNEYEMRWEIINKDCEDASDACDWNDYTVRKI